MKPADLLKDWVKAQHQGQLIRRTAKPYFDHLLFVAETAGAATELGYEIGLCHDLLEDTEITIDDLYNTLTHFGYTITQATQITACVTELTDVFTKKAYPDLSKPDRKEREAARMATISATAQTVKYADLIYNIAWVLQYDHEHAERYLLKKRLLLTSMTCGDQELLQQALTFIKQALGSLTAEAKQ